MNVSALAPIILVLCLGAMSPGPSLAVLLRNTMEGGKKRGVACGIVHGVGMGIYAFIAIAGIAQLKETATEAGRYLELAGGAFLIFLAASMLRHAPGVSKDEGTGTRGFVEGFLTAFLNPKILVFLLAIFSQFVQADFSWTARTLVASLALVIDAGWYVLVALIISGTPLLGFLQRNARWVDRVMASLLAGLGIWILL